MHNSRPPFFKLVNNAARSELNFEVQMSNVFRAIALTKLASNHTYILTSNDFAGCACFSRTRLAFVKSLHFLSCALNSQLCAATLSLLYTPKYTDL